MHPDCSYVSRGGLKLRHALDTFAIDVTGLECADLGCSTGGFTDCLLQAGAKSVTAVDTAYGQLAWKLRQDSRVITRERANALHAEPPPSGVDLVVVDLGWTTQKLVIPVACTWLRKGGRIITLIKPHYELKALRRDLPPGGVLSDAEAQRITNEVVASIPAFGAEVLGLTKSPILGSAGSSSKGGKGNAEWLALLTRPPQSAGD